MAPQEGSEERLQGHRGLLSHLSLTGYSQGNTLIPEKATQDDSGISQSRMLAF